MFIILKMENTNHPSYVFIMIYCLTFRTCYNLQFDYVIFTGDIPPHNVWNQTRSDQTSAMNVLTKYLKTYLPDKIVYNTLGNHESAPVDRYVSHVLIS